ncbi:MAG TPA: FAD-linked oxidase, partial [Actinotalea sp.]
MATSDTVPRVSVDELRQAVKGRVIEPTEPDYDALRTVMLGGVDPRPAVIVRPVDDADIAEVVGYAQAS